MTSSWLALVLACGFAISQEPRQPSSDVSAQSMCVVGRVLASDGTPVAAELRASTWSARGGTPAAADVEGKTGTDGRFELPIAIPGLGRRELSLTLEVEATGYVTRREGLLSRGRPFAPGGTLDLGDLRLDLGTTVSGRLIRASDRSPVVGAALLLVRGGSVATTRSDDNGQFRFEHVGNGGVLYALADGLAVLRTPIPPGEDDRPRDTGTLELHPGWELEGIVTDISDEPVEGAAVGGSEWAAEAWREAMRELLTTTSMTGRFLLRGLPDPGQHGVLDLSVTHPELAGWWGPRAVDVTSIASRLLRLVQPVRLARLVRITGQVVDEVGRPVPWAECGAYSLALMGDVRSPCESDAEGHFELQLSEPDAPWTVDASAPGHRRATIDIVPSKSGSIPVMLVLTPFEAGPLALRIVDAATGAGLEHATAELRASDDGNTRQQAFESDAEGRLTLTDVPRGRYEMEVRHQACEPTEPVGVEVGAEAQSLVVSLDCSASQLEGLRPRNLVIRGRIVDAAGVPLPGASIEIDYRSAATTDAAGRFRLDYELVPVARVSRDDTLRLLVESDGYQSRIVEAPLDSADLGAIALAPGLNVSGEIRGLTANRIGAKQVRVWAGREDPSGGTIDHDGVVAGDRFHITGLSPGTWQITASLGDMQTTKSVDVHGELRDLVFELGETATVSGVAVVNGASPPGARVHLVATDVEWHYARSAQLDDLGRFRFEGIPLGPARLVLNWRGAGRTRDLVIEGDVELELSFTTRDLRGRVVDGGTGEPISGAEVVARGSGVDHDYRPMTVTASDGSFLLRDLLEGPWWVSVRLGDRRAGGTEVILGAAPQAELVLDLP